MESARKIIDAINRGVSPQELAREFPWEEIMGESAYDLLRFAQQSPNNQHSFQVLAYLFRVASGNDLWYATEVLSQTVRHPILSSDERKMILANLRSLLDRIKNQMSVEPPAQEFLRKYWLMEGGYYTVSGAIFVETGKIEEANQNYLIAQGIFERLGLIQPGMTENGNPALPELDNEHRAGGELSSMDLNAKNLKPDGLKPVPTLLGGEPPAEQQVTSDREIFHPLPDVWVEDGQLHLPELEKADQDEIRQQALQIEQQSEILAGIQLQIQMYLNRRSVLAREVQTLEKRTAALKAAVARLEKKVDQLGDTTV